MARWSAAFWQRACPAPPQLRPDAQPLLDAVPRDMLECLCEHHHVAAQPDPIQAKLPRLPTPCDAAAICASARASTPCADSGLLWLANTESADFAADCARIAAALPCVRSVHGVALQLSRTAQGVVSSACAVAPLVAYAGAPGGVPLAHVSLVGLSREFASPPMHTGAPPAAALEVAELLRASAPGLRRVVVDERDRLCVSSHAPDPFAAVWPQLQRATRLTSLEIGRFYIGCSAHAAALESTLPSLATLRELVVTKSRLQVGPVARALPRLTALTRLVLETRRLMTGPTDDMDMLDGSSASLLAPLAQLRVLRLAVSDHALQALAPGLASLTAVSHLAIADSEAAPSRSHDAIVRGVAQMPCLANLDMCSSCKGAHILRAMERCTALSHMRLLYCDLSDIPSGSAGAERCIARHTNLQSLTLTESSLTGAGLSALAPCLGEFVSLRSLDLARNCIACEGASALAPQLAHLTALTSLQLSANSIAVKGMAALTSSLSHLVSLEKLDISFNCFGDGGVEALEGAAGLSRLTALAHMCLKDAQLTQQGCCALARACLPMRALRELQLGIRLCGGIAEARAAMHAVLSNRVEIVQ